MDANRRRELIKLCHYIGMRKGTRSQVHEDLSDHGRARLQDAIQSSYVTERADRMVLTTKGKSLIWDDFRSN